VVLSQTTTPAHHTSADPQQEDESSRQAQSRGAQQAQSRGAHTLTLIEIGTAEDGLYGPIHAIMSLVTWGTRSDPPNLSISLSGGSASNSDCCSNGE